MNEKQAAIRPPDQEAPPLPSDLARWTALLPGIENQSILREQSLRADGADSLASQFAAIVQLDEAIMGLPSSINEAYIQVKQMAPRLVSLESNPWRFLQYHNHNPWDAALRLAMYWKYRKDTFGERFLLPFDLSDQGALTAKDIAAVQAGYCTPLPEDSMGCPVFHWDRNLMWSDNREPIEKIRAFFYLSTVMMQHSGTATKGWTIILSTTLQTQGTNEYLQYMKDVLRYGTAIKIAQIYILVRVENVFSQGLMTGFLSALIQSFTTELGGKPVVLIYSTGEEGYRKLREHGFTSNGLPVKLGGELNFPSQLVKAIRQAWPERYSTRIKFPPALHTTAVHPDAALQYSLLQLEQAILELPPTTTAAYLQAKVVAPHLIELESDPLQFLRYHDFDARDAAKRLAMYWKYRKDIFGERFSLPFDMSENGALTAKDIMAVEAGFGTIMPDDREGRSAGLWNVSMSRLDQRDDLEKLRSFFYFLTIIFKHPTVATLGGRGFLHISLPIKGKNDYVKMYPEVSQNAIPVKVKQAYILVHIESNLIPGLLNPLIGGLVDLCAPVFGNLPHVILYSSNDQLVQKLKQHGLSRSQLPKDLGGELDARYQLLKVLQHRWPPEYSTVLAKKCTHSESTRNPLVLEDVTAQIEESLEKLPRSLSAAYLEAKNIAPHLIELESNPIHFFEFHNRNASNAALRLATYWKYRKDIFGERFALPFDLSENGALAVDAIDAVEAGHCTFMPDDSEGRPTLCWHKNKIWTSGIDPMNQLRAFFYFATIITRNRASITKGVVAILSAYLPMKSTNENSQITIEILKNAIPLNIHKGYIVLLVDSHTNATTSTADLDRTIAFLARGMGGRPISIMYTSMNDCLGKLGEFGFSSDQLPVELGGELTFREQMLKELQRIFPANYATSFSSRQKQGKNIKSSSVIDDLEVALEEIPEPERRALMEAKDCTPYLLNQESNFESFLEFEHGNKIAASRRLASYWQLRQQVFGDKAFYPLGLPRDGALMPSAINVFHRGNVMLLPSNSRNVTVVLMESNDRRAMETLNSAWKQCLFFVLAVASKRAQSICFILHVYELTSVGLFVQHIFDFSRCFPLKVIFIECLSNNVSIQSESISEEMFLDRLSPRHRALVHVSQSIGDERISLHLRYAGVDINCLPASIGGTLCLAEHIKEWMKAAYESLSASTGGFVTKILPSSRRNLKSDRSDPAFATLELDGALKLVPESEKTDYNEAMRRSPVLVFLESPPVAFLETENFNSWAAALRLVTYWRWRRRLFGDRAFLPLSLSGEGALTKDDIAALQRGGHCVLPPTNMGIPVLYVDRSQYSDDISMEVRSRVNFYVLSKMSNMYKAARTIGVSQIVRANDKIALGFTGKFARTMHEWQEIALPIRIKSIHYVCARGTYPSSIFQDAVLPLVSHMMARVLPSTKSHFHITESEIDIAEKLRVYGFIDEGIPSELGGLWSRDEYLGNLSIVFSNESVGVDRATPNIDIQHKDLNFDFENSMLSPIDTSMLIHNTVHERGVTFPTALDQNAKQRSDVGLQPEDLGLDLDALADDLDAAGNALRRIDDAKLRKQTIGIIYSRRKRKKERRKMDDMLGYRDQLRRENDNLKQTHAVLEKAMEDATRIIGEHETQKFNAKT